jgi:hypothetical protein
MGNEMGNEVGNALRHQYAEEPRQMGIYRHCRDRMGGAGPSILPR